jgi:hypothetical protein
LWGVQETDVFRSEQAKGLTLGRKTLLLLLLLLLMMMMIK